MTIERVSVDGGVTAQIVRIERQGDPSTVSAN